MRRSFKLAYLAGLSFATYFATSKIDAKQMGRNSPRGVEQASIRSLKPGEVPPPPVLPDGTGLVEQVGLRQHRVEVRDGEVFVAASVDISNIRPGGVYLWRLQAFRTADEAKVLDVPYEQQMFEMHPSGRMAQSFSESFRLLPGKYRVVLSLHFFRRGYDLTQPPDLDEARMTRRLWMPKNIEIP